MEAAYVGISLAALLVTSSAAPQQFQLLGATVVDQDFFYKGELLPGETLRQFIRRHKREKGLSPEEPPELEEFEIRTPRMSASREPLGLSAGAFAVLRRIDTSFSCEGLPYGYYSDPSNDCHVYHVCQPLTIPTAGSAQSVRVSMSASFFCNVNQVFDQRLLTCVPDTLDFDCAGVQRRYASSNSQFFAAANFNEADGGADDDLVDQAADGARSARAFAILLAASELQDDGGVRFVELTKRSFQLLTT